MNIIYLFTYQTLFIDYLLFIVILGLMKQIHRAVSCSSFRNWSLPKTSAQSPNDSLHFSLGVNIYWNLWAKYSLFSVSLHNLDSWSSITSIKFLHRLPFATAWKNLVLPSPSLSQCCLALALHNTSSSLTVDDSCFLNLADDLSWIYIDEKKEETKKVGAMKSFWCANI